MLPNSRQNARRNLHFPVFFVLSAFAAGCFQQSAPERIPTADTLEDCLAAPQTLQFAHLTAESAPLAEFPAALSGCPALWKLSLRGQTALSPLPSGIGALKGLRWLDLSEMGLSILPDALGSLPLQRLYLSDNAFESLPAPVGRLVGLDYLNLDRNRLSSLPPDVGAWTNLCWLRLNGNRLQDLPDEAAAWTSLRRLYLRGNDFAALPEAIASLPALEQLDLGRNPRLATLPDAIGGLSSLTRLDLDYTAVKTLPDSISRLENLRTLVLYGCPMDPAEVERVRSLLPAACRVEF